MARAPEVSVSYQNPTGTDEILRPTLVTVNGRSYRKMDISFGRYGADTKEEEVTAIGRRPLVYSDDVYDEGEDTLEELKDLEQTAGGGYLLRLPIPSVFFKYIIGREGKTKASIEKETKCRLRIPSRGQEGDIVIEGPTGSSVGNAKRRLEIIVWTNRSKERPTHFISIPLNQPNIMESFERFKEVVLATCSKDHGIVPAVFQLASKLHLTLGVLRIFSSAEEEKAKDVLKTSISKAVHHLGSKPAVISLKGVKCMKDDPSAVDVMYAGVYLTDHSNRLQQFVDEIVTHFLQEAPDLIEWEFERDGVKLHATVMNSKFVTSEEYDRSRGNMRFPESGGHRKPPIRKSFDGRGVIRELREFGFGEVPLQTLHLSKRGEFGSDGFYRCIQQYSLKEF